MTEVETERLLLRQWRDDDVPVLAGIYADPEVVRFLIPLDLDGTRAQVARFRRGWAEDGAAPWAVVEKATGRLVGRVGVQRHRDWPLEDGPYELGWTFVRDVWGRGYATEAGGAARDWGFGALPVDRLLSIAQPENTRSTAVMRRLGFTRRGDADWRGYRVDWYALDRAAWVSGRSG